VAYRPIPKWLFCKQGMFLANSLINTFLLLASRVLIMEQLGYNNENTVFSIWSMLRCYKRQS
jgi:hypothetical protein